MVGAYGKKRKNNILKSRFFVDAHVYAGFKWNQHAHGSISNYIASLYILYIIKNEKDFSMEIKKNVPEKKSSVLIST